MTIAVIIPARYESTRFPGKPLAKINGKRMVEWVINAALESRFANKVIVATEDERIYKFVCELTQSTSKTLEVCITSKEHKCGTDRLVEVIKNNPDIQYIVNVQGDEPLMPSTYIDKVIEKLSDRENVVSLISPLTYISELNDPNIVKVVLDKDSYALYFSRAPIPFDRDSIPKLQSSVFSSGIYFRHIGIYGYTRDALLQFSMLPQSSLEVIEQLEQLRFLENGIKIKLELVPQVFPAVDRPEDIKTVERILNSSKTII